MLLTRVLVAHVKDLKVVGNRRRIGKMSLGALEKLMDKNLHSITMVAVPFSSHARIGCGVVGGGGGGELRRIFWCLSVFVVVVVVVLSWRSARMHQFYSLHHDQPNVKDIAVNIKAPHSLVGVCSATLAAAVA